MLLTTGHQRYLNQCWPSSMTPYVITRPQWVNVVIPGMKIESKPSWCCVYQQILLISIPYHLTAIVRPHSPSHSQYNRSVVMAPMSTLYHVPGTRHQGSRVKCSTNIEGDHICFLITRNHVSLKKNEHRSVKIIPISVQCKVSTSFIFSAL